MEYVTMYLNERSARDMKGINQLYGKAFKELEAAKKKKDQNLIK
jgi:hypothetical protein